MEEENGGIYPYPGPSNDCEEPRCARSRNFRGFPHHALESDFSRNWICNGVLEVEIRAPDLPIELNVRENDRESLRRTAKVLG